MLQSVFIHEPDKETERIQELMVLFTSQVNRQRKCYMLATAHEEQRRSKYISSRGQHCWHFFFFVFLNNLHECKMLYFVITH